RVRQDVLLDARVAVLGLVQAPLAREQLAESGGARARRVLQVDDDEAGAIGLELQLGRVDGDVVSPDRIGDLRHQTTPLALSCCTCSSEEPSAWRISSVWAPGEPGPR